MEDEKIEAVKQYRKLQPIWDIQIFPRFANFYWQFIQAFSQITAPLISMLKISGNIDLKTESSKSSFRVGGSSRVGRDGNGNKINDDEVNGNEFGNKEVEKKVQKSSKSKKMVKSDFFTLGVKLAFTKLR